MDQRHNALVVFDEMLLIVVGAKRSLQCPGSLRYKKLGYYARLKARTR